MLGKFVHILPKRNHESLPAPQLDGLSNTLAKLSFEHLILHTNGGGGVARAGSWSKSAYE